MDGSMSESTKVANDSLLILDGKVNNKNLKVLWPEATVVSYINGRKVKIKDKFMKTPSSFIDWKVVLQWVYQGIYNPLPTVTYNGYWICIKK